MEAEKARKPLPEINKADLNKAIRILKRVSPRVSRGTFVSELGMDDLTSVQLINNLVGLGLVKPTEDFSEDDGIKLRIFELTKEAKNMSLKSLKDVKHPILKLFTV